MIGIIRRSGILHLSFGGEVNHFPAFLVHFPAENVDSTALFAVFPRESEPLSRESGALSPEVIKCR